jgi:dihydroorotate dehydrogenase (NAD+) catalytic subunit
LGLETDFAGIKLRNPTVLASGILGTNAALLKRVAEEGAGAVTMKSIGPCEKEGHSNPCVLAWEHGLINAVGLPSPGCKNMEGEWAALDKRNFPLIASIYGSSVEEFSEVALAVAKHKPDMIEVNISCPNTKKEGMVFGLDPETAAEVTKAVKKSSGKIPVMPKLTPQAPNIALVAKACEKAGADAICAINTLGPGMLIDTEARKPVLANRFGGISGPAIKPIALRCVYQIFEAVKVPVLGMGGVCSGRDAIEMVMAGATALGIGSAAYYQGMGVFKKVCGEIREWMQENGVKGLGEIRGAAHEN